MDPITVAMIGVQVASGLAQFYQSEKARGASKKELNKLRNQFDSIVPADYDYTIEDPPELMTSAPTLPVFNPSDFTPELLQSVGEFNPQIAEFVRQEAPELLQETETTKEGLDVQREAMRKYMDVARGGFDPDFAERLQKGQDIAGQEARSAREGALMSAQRRGVAGSGLEQALAIEGTSSAQDRLAKNEMSAATESYRNQLAAMRQAADLGGSVRAQEMSTQEKNLDAINAFNQTMTRDYQNYLNTRASNINQGMIRNLDNAQSLSNQNVAALNASKKDQRNTEMDMVRLEQSNIANQNAAKMQNYNARAGERDRLNQLKKQAYSDQLNKISGQSGLQPMIQQNILGSAQDRNKAIQGITDVGTRAASDYQQRRDAREREDRMYERLQDLQRIPGG